MADYRNQSITFVQGSLNLASPPEQLPEGDLTRSLNLRANSEGVIEARPTKMAFAFTQKTLNGYVASYPNLWSTGSLRAIRYIGEITVNGATDVAGYLSIHAATPLPLGKADSGYRVFINGAVVQKITSWGTYAPLDPTGLSIIRSNTPNSLPIIIVDGQWYFLLKNVNLDSGSVVSYITINTGYTTLDSVPVVRARRLGIPKPAAAPTFNSNTTSGATDLTGSYYYRVSGYDSQTGFQGPPSAISAVKTAADEIINPTWTDTNTYQNFTHFRVWRLGGTLTDWRLVGSVASTNSGGAITFADSKSDALTALEELLDTTSVEIFNSIDDTGATATATKLNDCFGPYIGKYLFWVGDPRRKNYVYWNTLLDMGRHDPSLDLNVVTDPGEELLNGFVFGNSTYVFSDRKLYSLDYNGDLFPVFQPREIPIGIGAVGKYAFAIAPHAIFLCSKDGIYVTSGQPEPPDNITQQHLNPIFRGESVYGLDSIDYARADEIRLAATNKEAHFLYPGAESGDLFHLVYDISKRRWTQWTRQVTSSVYFNEGVNWNQLLLGDLNSQIIYAFDDNFSSVNETFDAQYRSASMDLGASLTFKEFGSLILDFDPEGADIELTPFYNAEKDPGTTLTTGTGSDRAGRRIASFSLGDYYARNFALDLSWVEEPNKHPRFYKALLLFREDEEEVKHWEHPAQSLGQGGLYHIKDSYWGVRANAAITLKVEVDGHEDIYENIIPSTSGERKKIYVEFLPRQGNVWRFTLDSSQPFRLYGEDTVLFAKPWQTENSYQALTPFSQAGYAAYLRKGGGT